jgi:hypothetical protein
MDCRCVGFDALAAQRTGKRTLRTVEVEARPAPRANAREIVALRKRLRLSRPLFAHYLRANLIWQHAITCSQAATRKQEGPGESRRQAP